MALRGNKIDTSKENYGYGLDSNIAGFSINTFRESNKVVLFIENDKEIKRLFQAYYKGGFGFTAGMEISSLNQEMMGILNGMGPIWRSALKSVGNSLGSGSWSGAFDTPMKPYIKGTKPLEFELHCVLPLMNSPQKDESAELTGNPFKDNIERPINDLLMTVLPSKSSAFDNVATAVSEKADEAIKWLFSDTGGSFWNAVQGVVEGFKEDFFGGIYMLNNPAQFNGKNKLVLRVGPWRVEGVLVSQVKIDYSPLIYTDGTTVYPAFANVTMSCQTMQNATIGILNIGNDYSSKKLENFLPKDTITSE